jgi:hypothetical protein
MPRHSMAKIVLSSTMATDGGTRFGPPGRQVTRPPGDLPTW